MPTDVSEGSKNKVEGERQGDTSQQLTLVATVGTVFPQSI